MSCCAREQIHPYWGRALQQLRVGMLGRQTPDEALGREEQGSRELGPKIKPKSKRMVDYLAGMKDIQPQVEGFKELFGKGIGVCLYCEGVSACPQAMLQQR